MALRGGRAATSTVRWSDAQGLEDLARLDTGFRGCAGELALEPGWTRRWTTTWRFGRTPVVYPVRDLAEAEAEIVRSRPVRRFTWRTGQWHRPGLEYLVSTGRHHGFESFEEESLLLVADFAADLTEALSQPFRLRFESTAGSMEHTPDFLLLTGTGPWLVDVRPGDRIRPEDALKFAAAAEAALAAGWRYSVVSGWRENVPELVDALSAGRRQLSDPIGLQGELLGAVAAGPLNFGDLVGRCSVPAVARAHAVHLMWHRRLGIDVSAPLTDTSPVRLAPRDAGTGAAA